MYFPISGVECPFWLPPVVSFSIATVVASAGVSGAFLILPFQMSVLGYTSPSVSATNLLYNVIAIPGGVIQYLRERRMAWPVVWSTLAGTLPGVLVGAVVRVKYFAGARQVKLFVGLVLLWLGYRLLMESYRSWWGGVRTDTAAGRIEAKFSGKLPPSAIVRTRHVSLREVVYEFWGEQFRFDPLLLWAFSLAVGIAGGIYGIGGGALLAPFLVTVFHLPVYTIAGAALLGTYVTSIVGAVFFELLSYTRLGQGTTVRPDWMLGLLFGLGGLAGMNLGARLQKYMPERAIRLLLGLLVTGVAVRYIWQFFA